jgi:hypothetical protein
MGGYANIPLVLDEKFKKHRFHSQLTGIQKKK